MPNQVVGSGNVPLDNTPLEYSLLVVGERAGGHSKCRACKRYINIKGELYFQVFKPSSLHGSSYTKYFHPECLEYPDAPDANAFVDTLVDGSKKKLLNNAEGKNKLVQDMNKDARTKSTEPASGTAPARVRIGKKIDTLPNLETALPWDPSYWKPEWEGVLFQNAGIRDMLIDAIKYYGERAEKGDDLAKVVAGVWIGYYIKVIDFVVGLKEEITVQSAKALPHTSNGVVSEEVAKCISMYAGDEPLNTIIENVKAGDQDADEWEEKEAVAKEAAAKEAAATAKGDNKEGMESVRSDAEEEQQLKDSIQLSLVDAQEGDDNKDAGADEDMEEVEKKVREVEVAEEMDEPKENEEEV